MSIEIENNRRIRNFAFIFYVNSSPLDWETRLRDLHLPGYYICHNRDLNADDSPKEPHIHVLIMSEGLYTIKKVKRLVAYVGGEKTIYQEVNSLNGYARYLCHLDDPLKHRYEFSEVRNMGKCNYEDYINPKARSIRIGKEIAKFCRENQIYVYADLIDYCMDNQEEWLEFLWSKRHGRNILEYMKSRYWSNTHNFSPAERSEVGREDIN
jgi:hypothetical protein